MFLLFAVTNEPSSSSKQIDTNTALEPVDENTGFASANECETIEMSLPITAIVGTVAAEPVDGPALRETRIEHDDLLPDITYLWPNDPAQFAKVTISSGILKHAAGLGPCQPTAAELPDGIFPKTKLRSFSEEYFQMKMPPPDCTRRRREWLSYSPFEDRVYCIVCMLHGMPDAKQDVLVTRGFNDWKHLNRKILIHEMTPEHVHSELNRGMYLAHQRIDIEIVTGHNSIISENREVVKTLLQITLFLARHCLPFRGHDEKANNVLNRGLFLGLVHLMSKHHPILSSYLARLEENTRNRVTFMSNKSQNTMLNVLATIVQEKILQEIRAAGVFSVIIDTTTDVSTLDQFAFVIRCYTGLGMFELFSKICNEHALQWKTKLIAQSYDGAANMQGEYSGLRTYIQKENSSAIYVWCFAHVLNLVVVDTCDSCAESKDFFGTVQSVVDFMSARKRKEIYVQCQKRLNHGSGKRVRRLKYLSTTRWTSHFRAIDAIEDTFDALKSALAELKTDSDRKTSKMAGIFLQCITQFKFILTLFVMKRIFEITTPLSVYLQSKQLDFLRALQLVDGAKNQLTALSSRNPSDEQFSKIIQMAEGFAAKHELDETRLPDTRVARKKIMPGETARDENPEAAIDRFRKSFYEITATAEQSISRRFEQSRNVLKDLSILSEERITAFNRGIALL